MKRARGVAAAIRVTGAVALAIAAPTAAASSQAVVPLVLGHVDVVLDSATWTDVEQSAFLHGGFSAVDSGWSISFGTRIARRPLQLFGKYNYLEIAGPDPAAGSPAGQVSITLVIEHPADFERFKKLTGMSEEIDMVAADRPVCVGGLSSYCEGATRTLPLAVANSAVPAPLHIVLFGWDRAQELGVVDSMAVTNRSSARFLAPVFDADKPFKYISGATLAVPVTEIAAISTVLRRDGIKVVAEGEGAIIDLGGITVRLIPPWAGAGVKELRFALTHDVPANPVYTFGPRSHLRFGPGAVAVWDFNSP